MPRQARFDAPGTWHHGMGREIEKAKIFCEDGDREDFFVSPYGFAESLLSEADEREREMLRLALRGRGLDPLIKEIAEGEGVVETELRSGKRGRKVSRARRVVGQVAVARMGYPGAEGARVLGVTTSAVVRASHPAGLAEIRKYL